MKPISLTAILFLALAMTACEAGDDTEPAAPMDQPEPPPGPLTKTDDAESDEGDGDGDGDGEPSEGELPPRADDDFEVDHIAITTGTNYELVVVQAFDAADELVAVLWLSTTFGADPIDQYLRGVVDFSPDSPDTHRQKAQAIDQNTVEIEDSGEPISAGVLAQRLAKIHNKLEDGALESGCAGALIDWLSPAGVGAVLTACRCGAWWNLNHPEDPVVDLLDVCEW